MSQYAGDSPRLSPFILGISALAVSPRSFLTTRHTSGCVIPLLLSQELAARLGYNLAASIAGGGVCRPSLVGCTLLLRTRLPCVKAVLVAGLMGGRYASPPPPFVPARRPPQHYLPGKLSILGITPFIICTRTSILNHQFILHDGRLRGPARMTTFFCNLKHVGQSAVSAAPASSLPASTLISHIPASPSHSPGSSYQSPTRRSSAGGRLSLDGDSSSSGIHAAKRSSAHRLAADVEHDSKAWRDYVSNHHLHIFVLCDTSVAFGSSLKWVRRLVGVPRSFSPGPMPLGAADVALGLDPIVFGVDSSSDSFSRRLVRLACGIFSQLHLLQCPPLPARLWLPPSVFYSAA
ncbi:hypothetical protein FB45DRAFT_870260 [Roridomyces roridus]|uniref:Uncharacterized protein n=1 Tax=Roridomyces roridus TaxID=1738132 RepID=A0AAD7BI92_9AGAR|nr:hypothetical protein FB45DRAFT_870260 [Roridomyces roridus]